ncbi:MAG TPA: DUF1801 domain-containing protein [Vicinamibacterales bacterium]|nr:DUF1801 domain-containing protein [Vicinamibacterales bacterium]
MRDSWKTQSKTDVAAKRRIYFASFPPPTRRQLAALRRGILAAAPGAIEVFTYGIPGFRFEGARLLWYAGWKRHTSLYPVGAAVRRAVGTQLAGYKSSTGTIQFPLEAPPSAALVKKIVQARIAQIRAGAPVRPR